MGQLERYGLYVLCLVIVLILGVAIWGGGPDVVNAAGDSSHQSATGGGAGSLEAGVTAPPAQGSKSKTFFDHVEVPDFDAVPSVDPAGSGPAGGSGGSAVQEVPVKTEPKKRDDTAPPAGPRDYTVRPGDSMAKIARVQLGDEGRVDEIRRLNPSVDPRRMRPGTTLKLPGAAPTAKNEKNEKNGKTSKAWREYTVRKGDSPYSISIRVYGTSKHAKRIMEVNGIDDARKLRPKQVLKIPPLN